MSESKGLAVIASKLPKPQFAAYQALNDASKSLFEKIFNKLQALSKVEIVGRYELGELLCAAENDEGKYGQNCLEHIATALGSTDSAKVQLWECMRLTKAFDRETFDALLERRMANGASVTWTHLRQLMQLVKGKDILKLRGKVIEQMFDESLSSRQLGELIQQSLGENQQTTRGPSLPRTPFAAMSQVEKCREAIVSRLAVWDKCLWEKLEKLPPEECTPQLRQQVEAIKSGQEELLVAIKDQIDHAEESLKRLNRVLTAKDTKTPPKAIEHKPAAKATNNKPVEVRGVKPTAPAPVRPTRSTGQASLQQRAQAAIRQVRQPVAAGK